MSPPVERSERLGIRIAPEEAAMLHTLADEAGLSASDIVRMLIRDAYRVRHGDKKPKR